MSQVIGNGVSGDREPLDAGDRLGMSIARLVITAVIVEGWSQAETARAYGGVQASRPLPGRGPGRVRAEIPQAPHLTIRDRRTVITLLFTEGLADTGFLAFASAEDVDGAGFTATPSDFLEVVAKDVQVNFDYVVSSPGSATALGLVQPTFVLTPLAPVESPPIEDQIGEPPSVCCDSTPRVGPATGGCIYHKYVPTYDVSTTNNDTAQVVWHILWAQRNLVNHWGWQGHGPSLNRTRNQTICECVA